VRLSAGRNNWGRLNGIFAALGATSLDSHASMAVVGSNCTMIATSGHYANVAPFFSNLPTMDMVEMLQLHMTILSCM
jgi:hypothetical protein